jgi:hypothetical protein
MTRDSQKIWAEANKFVRDWCHMLKQETGLDFMKEDLTRIGNLEWLAFPAASDYENALVEAVCHPSEDLEREFWEVTLLPGAAPPGEQLLVRCRVSSFEGTLLDECRLVVATEETQVRFSEILSEGTALVQIWRCLADTDQWWIWFSHEYAVIRRFSGNMGIGGLQGKFDAPWLQKLVGTRVEDRAAKVRQLSQTRYRPFHAGIPSTRLSQANQQARTLASRLFPPPSGGGFFPKGWEGDGRLNLVEWFRKLTDDTGAKRILLMDPFFDEFGIELFARAQSSQLEYVVLANTQTRGDGDKAVVLDDSPSSEMSAPASSGQETVPAVIEETPTWQ